MSTNMNGRWANHLGAIATVVSLATVAASAYTVWLVGDPRAAGVVVMVVGVLVAGAVAYVEYGSAPAHQRHHEVEPKPAATAEAGTLTKAA